MNMIKNVENRLSAMKGKILIILGFIFCGLGCATVPENDNISFLVIKGHLARNQNAIAAEKIVEFKKQYPSSFYLCELLPFLTDYQTRKNLHPREFEAEYKRKCIK